MADITELNTNLNKMQCLLKNAQSEIQKKTFQEIIKKLQEQLKEQKTRLEPEQTKLEPEQTKSINVFQGVGLLYGKIVKRYDGCDEFFDVVIKDKRYELVFINPKVKKYIQSSYNPELNKYITVYPRIIHFPDKNLQHKLSFTLIGAHEKSESDLKVNEFKLSGFWQFIAVCKCPVISVHRNRSKGDRLSEIKKKYKSEKFHKVLTRANHVPVLWKDCKIKPFRFNPKLDKQSDRYFVKIKAKFLPNRGQWGFIELLENATLDIPKFYKP